MRKDITPSPDALAEARETVDAYMDEYQRFLSRVGQRSQGVG